MPSSTKIMLIRHGEKPGDPDASPGIDAGGNVDPESLTARGWERARALVTLFNPTAPATLRTGLAVPEYLFATAVSDPASSKRPLQTLTPLAASFAPHRDIDASIKASHIDKLCKEATHAGGTVLIAWRHEMISDIAEALTDDPVPKEWPADRFDVIWIFDLDTHGNYRFSQTPERLLPGDRDDLIPV